MTLTQSHCDWFQKTGRHDLQYQSIEGNYEIWECECGKIERYEVGQ